MGWYVPTPHGKQVDSDVAASLELYFPALHEMQEFAEEEPAFEFQRPGEQLPHVLDEMAPSAGLHFPASQAVQTSELLAPSAELQEPGVQDLQVEWDEAPTTVL